MKKLLMTFFLLIAATSYASQNAVTDTGEEVILHYDGTWIYSKSGQTITKKIKTNDKNFTKPKSSSFQVKSTRNNSSFWVNTHKWSFTKDVCNAAAEYEFKLKNKDLRGMAITEEMEVPLESLVNNAVINAKKIMPDVKVNKKEYRIVNDVKVVYMIMTGVTVDGIKASFEGYYHSDSSGVTQYVVYTSPALVQKYRSEIDDFLNGFGLRIKDSL